MSPIRLRLGVALLGVWCALGARGCGRDGGAEAGSGAAAEPPAAPRAEAPAVVEGRVLWRTRREALVEPHDARGSQAPEWVDILRAPGAAWPGVDAGDGDEVEAACRVAVVSLGGGEGADEVGLYITAAALGRSLDALDALPEIQRPGVIVLRIDSRGGRLAEVPFIADTIEERAKGRCRVVAWIEEARSAGALIAMACDEIVMMPGAVLGDAVAHAPGADVQRDGLAMASLRVGEIVSRLGGHDPAIVRAMQTAGALSCDFGEDGSVVWRDDAGGAELLSPAGSPLVLEADAAERFGVSIGTAADRDALAQVLGCAGEVAFVDAGDAAQRDHRAATPLVVARAEALAVAVAVWADACEGATPAEVAVARDRMDRLRALVESAPFLARYEAMGEGWLTLLGERIDACASGGDAPD